MGQVIGQVLPFAVGVAISPLPIIAVVLMLLSPHARAASAGFLVGWLAGIVAVTTLFVFLAGVITPSEDGPSTTVSWVKLVLGVVLVLAAVKQWRARPRPGDEPALPGWMSAIDQLSPVKATGLAAVLAGVNPKNLAMCLAAGSTIGGADLSTGEAVVAVAVFTVLAASTVAVPVIAYAVAADRMRGPLDSLRAWLLRENSVVMGVLLLVIGVVLLGNGISGVS